MLIQPFAVSIATKAFVAIDAPGYQEPRIETSVDGVRTVNLTGQRIGDFDGLLWQSDYRLLRFTAYNPTTRFLQNVEITLPLPSCAVYTNSEGPSVQGNFKVRDPHTARVFAVENVSGDGYSCTKEIVLSTFPPGERIAVEFVIRKDFSKCDRLTGIHPKNEYRIQYLWQEHNEIFEVDRTVEMSKFDLEANYGEALEQEPMTVEDPHRGDNSNWEYYAILVGIDSPNWESGLENCVRSD